MVQAKRYKRTVGVKAVQEAVASKQYYGCDKAMVVTNSYFSQQAQALAKANQVELWDRDTLVARLLSCQTPATTEFASSTQDLVGEPIALQSAAPTCAKCGRPVSAKVQEYCMSHADLFEGLTYCYDHQQEIRSVHIVASGASENRIFRCLLIWPPVLYRTGMSKDCAMNCSRLWSLSIIVFRVL